MKPDPYTHKKLLEYVAIMVSQGWDEDTIRRELTWAGHSQKVIDATLEEFGHTKKSHVSQETSEEAKLEEVFPPEASKKKEESPPSGISPLAALFLMKSTSVEKTFSAIYFIFVFILIFWSGFATESPVANVFAGFLPIILTILTIFALSDYLMEDQKWIIFIVPIAWCIAFFVFAAYGAVSFFNVLDVQNVLALNFLLGIVFVGLIYFVLLMFLTWIINSVVSKFYKNLCS